MTILICAASEKSLQTALLYPDWFCEELIRRLHRVMRVGYEN
jgi:hypothetical protein